MIAMSKEQMVQYLKDYARIQRYMIYNSNIPIGLLFHTYMIQNGREKDANDDYYDRMRLVYTNYIYLKSFSIIEDFLLNRDDFLSNNDLVGVEKDCKIITAPADLTNKKIIQLIRNAFNHNDSPNFDRFKMSEDATHFQIEFADIRTQKEINNGVPVKPVKIEFDVNYLIKVNNIIDLKRQNLLFVSFDIPQDFNLFSSDMNVELDKIKFIHYYFNKKLPKEFIDKFICCSDINSMTKEQLMQKSKELHNLAKTISEPAEFKLDKFQKKKIISTISQYKKGYPELLDDDIDAIMFDLLQKVIPIPSMKLDDIHQQIVLSSLFYNDDNLSYEDVVKKVRTSILNIFEKKQSHNYIDNVFQNILKKHRNGYTRVFFKNIISADFFDMYPKIIYIDAVVTHCCKDKKIKISGKTYDREQIRNSFAHGRWYLTHDFKIALFDADPRNINDYKLEFIGNIDVDIFKEWADKYMQNVKEIGKSKK